MPPPDHHPIARLITRRYIKARRLKPSGQTKGYIPSPVLEQTEDHFHDAYNI